MSGPFALTSVAEPVEPKLFETRSRNDLFNKYLLQSVWYLLDTRGEDSSAAGGCIVESSLAARGGPPVLLLLADLVRSSTHSCINAFHGSYEHFRVFKGS